MLGGTRRAQLRNAPPPRENTPLCETRPRRGKTRRPFTKRAPPPRPNEYSIPLNRSSLLPRRPLLGSRPRSPPPGRGDKVWTTLVVARLLPPHRPSGDSGSILLGATWNYVEGRRVFPRWGRVACFLSVGVGRVSWRVGVFFPWWGRVSSLACFGAFGGRARQLSGRRACTPPRAGAGGRAAKTMMRSMKPLQIEGRLKTNIMKSLQIAATTRMKSMKPSSIAAGMTMKSMTPLKVVAKTIMKTMKSI
jgi:hypothetical protein